MKRFPNSRMKPVESCSSSKEFLVVYAFLLKALEFREPFAKCDEKMNFKKAGKVDAFEALTFHQKEQVLIHDYKNEGNFMIELLIENKNHMSKEQMYVIKSEKHISKISEAIALFEEMKGKGHGKIDRMTDQDTFKMPVLNIQATNVIDKLENVRVIKGKGDSDMKLLKVQENINLMLNEKGVLIENQGLIEGELESAMVFDDPPKRLILDSQFWVIFKEKDTHPYLIVRVSNPCK